MAQSTHSLSFDGTGYVEVASGLGLAAGSHYTVSMWAKPSSFTGAYSVLAEQGATTNSISWFLNGSGKLAIYTPGGTIDGSGSALSTGVWTHVALTFDGTTLRQFINGTQDSSGSGGSPANGETRFRFGARSASNTPLTGLLDDISIYSSALSAGTISGLAAGTTDPSTLSPILLLRLEEGSGTSTADTGSGGNNGTLSSGVTWSSDVPSQLAGGAARGLFGAADLSGLGAGGPFFRNPLGG